LLLALLQQQVQAEGVQVDQGLRWFLIFLVLQKVDQERGLIFLVLRFLIALAGEAVEIHGLVLQQEEQIEVAVETVKEQVPQEVWLVALESLLLDTLHPMQLA
jgi:hypothetical protein